MPFRPLAPLAAALAVSLMVAPTLAAAAQCHAASPAHVVPLVELFTSEGCSSCPPADRWLSTLGAGAGDFSKVVPLSMHVDYWDYIGWKDRFAGREYTDRQRRYARLRGTTTVYTPQVVLAGADFPDWGGGRFASRVQAALGTPARADLQLDASGTDPDALNVRVTARSSRPADTEVYFAVFDSGISSRVTRGENAGSLLTHDHVVRHLAGPFPVETAGAPLERLLKAPPPDAGARRGVAAFVQQKDGQVLQATACLLN